nr:MAG TPA: hypothetical protein [Caudoviricetes sp.]
MTLDERLPVFSQTHTEAVAFFYDEINFRNRA